MRSLFKKMMGGQNSHVPERVQAKLAEAFDDPNSIEWTFRENCYEALFYEDTIEKIARIDLEGSMIEYRINLSLDKVPAAVRTAASSHGELMNCISIHPAGEETVYEVIVRDTKLTRFMLIIKANGEMISKLKL